MMSMRPTTGMAPPPTGMAFSATGSSHTGSMRPTTTMGGGTTLGRIQAQVQEGTFTSTVYGYIRDHQYEEAVELLATQLEEFPRSRAAVSLMAYCYYMMGDYGEAASLYEQLTKICPNIEEYRVYYAQSLYKAGAYAESNRLCTLITSPQNQTTLNKLQAAIAYEQEDIPQTKSFLEQAPETDTDMLVLRACVLSKEGSYEEALEKFKEAQNAVGFSAALTYNMALMYYKMEQHGPALRHLAEIIDRGVEGHPELNIGTNTEGGEARSVGNTQLLRETALIEAFNLKAAIEYASKNMQAAKEALTDMPPRTDAELDPVTLHNTALINMDENPTNAFKKFNFLLQNPPFPPETFQNLLLFYCKYQYYDLAADVLAENPHLAWQYLSQNNQSLYDFLDGLITAQTSPAEAYRKFDILAQKMVQQLRNMTRRIQEADQSQDAAVAKTAVRTYDVTLEEYIPVLMAQANIYWEMENYPMVEQLFRQSADFCSENDVWKQNVAHVFFMQETKFKEAIRYYSPVVEANRENILSCSAIVLANLCVSYIMTAQNEQAEEIMRRIERAEERLTYEDSSKQPLHLCIVNLVIGTLYCSKGNFEFGISRIIKSLEPYDRKIMTDTWFYAKRCFLALAMNLAKHMVSLKDSSFEEILFFFDQADLHGERIFAFIHPDPSKQDTSPRNTARWEARQLKKLYLTLKE